MFPIDGLLISTFMSYHVPYQCHRISLLLPHYFLYECPTSVPIRVLLVPLLMSYYVPSQRLIQLHIISMLMSLSMSYEFLCSCPSKFPITVLLISLLMSY